MVNTGVNTFAQLYLGYATGVRTVDEFNSIEHQLNIRKIDAMAFRTSSND